MKVIAVGTLKGGTGKTTIAFNLGGALAEDKKVLLIDIDPQCNLTNNVGVDITDVDIYSSRDIFETKGISPEKLVVKKPIHGVPNMDIIPGNILLTATELKIWSRASSEWILSNYIEDNRKFFEHYDYVLIDTNPSMSFVNRNAFIAADSIILVTDIDENSRSGLELFNYMWDEIRTDARKDPNVHALIINRADNRTGLTKDMIEYCQNDEDLKEILVPQVVTSRVAFARAALKKQPVTRYRNGAEAAEEIRNVRDYLIERGVL